MKITVISDTHNEHEKLGTLSGDVLIHCGDMFNMFSRNDDEFERMDDWFGRQEFDVILCTGGNHDFALESKLHDEPEPFENAVYLQDREFIHQGVVFYGAPWIPALPGQAFYRTNSELEAKWSNIRENIDVLITHTPPAGFLDISSSGLQLGCKHLADRVATVSPSFHCFGHVHASSGLREAGKTTYINAALVNSNYELSRKAVEFSI